MLSLRTALIPFRPNCKHENVTFDYLVATLQNQDPFYNINIKFYYIETLQFQNDPPMTFVQSVPLAIATALDRTR